MKNFSNFYIFTFASVMVIVVAALLSFVSEELKPRQLRNVEIETKTNILSSVDMTEGVKEASDQATFIEDRFDSFITESFVINSTGETVEGRDAFEITKNLKAELDKPVEERGLPIFVFESDDDGRKYIIPVRGKGLWGPIWGYVALKSDLNTISGAVFDHKGETPGLGAEINTDWFENAFIGKTLFNNEGEFVSITVVKGGADPSDQHAVDGISGGTITSKGLEDMLYDCINPYVSFFKDQMN